MRADSIVFAVAGMCFGVILGWVIGSQQEGARPSAVAPAPASAGQGTTRQAPPLDEARVQSLMTVITSDPKNTEALVQLANTYFDAERYDDAIKWYEQGLSLNPNNPDARTDLGISYYYSGQADRALQQFDMSLKINPRHTKTMLNQGIVLAFGKQDLAGAEAAWKRLIAIAPDSPEGRAARRGLEGIAAAGHPAATTSPGS